MILESLWSSILYVMADGYFWISMAVIVIMGVFIGSTLYGGCIKEIKKMIISLSIYAIMIMGVTNTRVIPDFYDGVFRVHHPFSGVATILLVTIFYLLGIMAGVITTNHAHKEK